MTFKTKSAALCFSLLNGEVVTIMDGFKKFLISNAPREISRQIEQKFGVTVSKVRKNHTSKFGHTSTFFEYRLNKTPHNKDGINKMRKYVEQNFIPHSSNGNGQQKLFS